MQPREILQFNALMNEGAVDRALVIKGEFAKEIKELKDAIAEWDKRGKIDARLKDLAAQTKAFQAETAIFDEKVAGFDAKLAKVIERESACADREGALTAKEAAAVKAASDLANAKDKHEAQVKADTEAMSATRADIALQLADLSSQRKELSAREQAVADKLAQLKAIAG